MSGDLGLGKLIETKQFKDAVHIAVAPVKAGMRLSPGDRIGFNDDGTVGKSSKPIGIVDPFLETPIIEGKTFWMLMYPNTITALRHEWTHPEFDEQRLHKLLGELDASLNGNGSKEWLESFAEDVGLSYDELIAAAKRHLKDGDEVYLNFDTPDRVYTDRQKFWEHFETMTGEPVPDPNATFFRCAC